MSPPFPPEDQGGIRDAKLLETNRLINLFYRSQYETALRFAMATWGQATHRGFGPREIVDAAWRRFASRLSADPNNYAIREGESKEIREKRWQHFIFFLIANEARSTRRHLKRQKRFGEEESLSINESEDSHGQHQLADPNSSTPLFCRELAEELFVWRATLNKVFQAIIDVYADGYDDSPHEVILIEVNKRLDRSERLSHHQLRTRREQLAAIAQKNPILRSLFRKIV